MERNGMATAALIMGLIAIISTFSSGMGFIFGALGITFALLSRREYQMNKMAHTGLILSIISTVASIVMIAAMLFMMYQSPETLDNIMNEYNQYLEDPESFGDSYFDDYFSSDNGNNYGFDFGNTNNEGGYKL